jgi:hypothetical protein
VKTASLNTRATADERSSDMNPTAPTVAAIAVQMSVR